MDILDEVSKRMSRFKKNIPLQTSNHAFVNFISSQQNPPSSSSSNSMRFASLNMVDAPLFKEADETQQQLVNKEQNRTATLFSNPYSSFVEPVKTDDCGNLTGLALIETLPETDSKSDWESAVKNIPITDAMADAPQLADFEASVCSLLCYYDTAVTTYEDRHDDNLTKFLANVGKFCLCAGTMEYAIFVCEFYNGVRTLNELALAGNGAIHRETIEKLFPFLNGEPTKIVKVRQYIKTYRNNHKHEQLPVEDANTDNTKSRRVAMRKHSKFKDASSAVVEDPKTWQSVNDYNKRIIDSGYTENAAFADFVKSLHKHDASRKNASDSSSSEDDVPKPQDDNQTLAKVKSSKSKTKKRKATTVEDLLTDGQKTKITRRKQNENGK